MNIAECLGNTDKGKLVYDRSCFFESNAQTVLEAIYREDSGHLTDDALIASLSTIISSSSSSATADGNVNGRSSNGGGGGRVRSSFGVSAAAVSTCATSSVTATTAAATTATATAAAASVVSCSAKPVSRDSWRLPAAAAGGGGDVSGTSEARSSELIEQLIDSTLAGYRQEARMCAYDKLAATASRLAQLRRNHSDRRQQLLEAQQLRHQQLQQQQLLSAQLLSSQLEQQLSVTDQLLQKNKQEVVARVSASESRHRQRLVDQTALLTQVIVGQQSLRAATGRVIELLSECNSALSRHFPAHLVTQYSRTLKSLMTSMDQLTSDLTIDTVSVSSADRAGHLVDQADQLVGTITAAIDEVKLKMQNTTESLDSSGAVKTPPTTPQATPTSLETAPTARPAPPSPSRPAPAPPTCVATPTCLATPTSCNQTANVNTLTLSTSVEATSTTAGAAAASAAAAAGGGGGVLMRYVFEDDLRRYEQLQSHLAVVQQRSVAFVADASLKPTRYGCQKAINTRLNSLIANNIAASVDTLSALLGQQLSSTAAAAAAAGTALKHQQQQPQHYTGAVDFCVDLLAAKFVRQGEEVVSAGGGSSSSSRGGGGQATASSAAAERLAQLMVSLWLRHRQLLVAPVLAHFYRRCPYLVPLIPQLSAAAGGGATSSATSSGGGAASDERSVYEYLQRCGYQVTFGDEPHSRHGSTASGATGGAASVEVKVESHQLFVRRMAGAARLYATLLVYASSSSSGGDIGGEERLPGVDTLWRWLTSVAGVWPRADVTATVLEVVIDTAQRHLAAVYGKQFVKLCSLLLRQYLPLIAQVTEEGGKGPLLRLEQLLSSIVRSYS